MPQNTQHCTMIKNAAILSARCFIIAWQVTAKRAILGRKDEMLLAAYSDISAFEDLILALLYGGFHIISRDISLQPMETSQDEKEVGAIYRRGIVFGSVLMVPCTALALFSSTYFSLTRQPEFVLSSSHTYFYYSLIAYTFDMLYRTQARTMIGLSMPLSTLIMDGVQAGIDVFCTNVFVNGKFGFSEKGVNSCAIAYVIAAVTTAAGYRLYLGSRNDLKKYALYDFHQLWNVGKTMKTIKEGMHIALNYSLELVALLLITTLCGLSGRAALAGVQVATAYGLFQIYILSGLSEATGIAMGNLLSPVTPHRAKQFKLIGDGTIYFALFFSVVSAGITLLCPQFITTLFLNDRVSDDDFAVVIAFLKIQTLIEILDSVRNAGINALAAASDIEFPCKLNVAALFFLSSILSLSSKFIFNATATTIYAVQLVGYAIVFVGTILRWKNIVPVIIKQSWNEERRVDDSSEMSIVHVTST